MPTARTETYSPVRRVAYFLEVGTQRLELPVRHGSSGALVEPSSGTITVTMSDGTELVSAAAVTMAGSIPYYDLTTTSSHTVGEGWTIVWSLTMADGNTYSYRFEAFLCDNPPYCPITVQDLWGGEGISELRQRVPQQWRATSEGGDGSGWQPVVDGVYYSLLQRLIGDGHRPWKIRNISGAYEWSLSLALVRACRHLPGDTWAKRATDFSFSHRAAAGGLRFQYDDEAPTIRRAAQPVIRLAPVGRPVY